MPQQNPKTTNKMRLFPARALFLCVLETIVKLKENYWAILKDETIYVGVKVCQ